MDLMSKSDPGRAPTRGGKGQSDPTPTTKDAPYAGATSHWGNDTRFSALATRARLGRSLDRLPKTTQVYEILRAAIINMELPPESVLPEKAICADMEVSRTPYREAVLQLASENLVTAMPGEGTFVNKIRLRDVLEGQLVRDTLEARLSRLAARNFRPEHEEEFTVALFRQHGAAKRGSFDEFFILDNEFHQMICDLSGFENAWKTIHMATGQLDRIRRLAFPMEDNMSQTIEEHNIILSNMKRNDEIVTERSFLSHIDTIHDAINLIRKRAPNLIENGDDSTRLRIR